VRPDDGVAAAGRVSVRRVPVRHVDAPLLVQAGRAGPVDAGPVVRPRDAVHAGSGALHGRVARPLRPAGRPQLRRHLQHAHAAAARQRPDAHRFVPCFGIDYRFRRDFTSDTRHTHETHTERERVRKYVSFRHRHLVRRSVPLSPVGSTKTRAIFQNAYHRAHKINVI